MKAIGVGVSVLIIAIILAALAASGCQTIDYKEFHAQSVLRDLDLGSLDVEVRPDGTHVIHLRDVESMQTEGLKSAVEGAVIGASKAIKP